MLPEAICPSRFAYEFWYNQHYVGNPNTLMAFIDSLIDDARAWRYFIVSYTKA